MSYTNQRDHQQLDRFAILDTLRTMAGATVAASNAPRSREEQLKDLTTLSGSGLERLWLQTLDEAGHRLPTHAQRLVAECHALPDFYYADRLTAVFIDGPHHAHEEEKQLDAQKTACLEDAGYSVVRFAQDPALWPEIFAKHPDVFGSAQ